MRNILSAVLLLPVASLAFAAEPWEDESVSEINRLPARSVMNPVFADGSSAVMSLDGEWDFEWRNGDDVRTATVTVPGCWQLQGDFDPPQYVSHGYIFKYDPPRVTSEPPKDWTTYRYRNPHGLYRRSFVVPEAWRNRRIILRLNGYSSAVYVRLNGKEVGYGEDGRLPSEFDLTPYLNASISRPARAGGAGRQHLELEVLKFSDGSYVEDQDFWRLSGLFRNVELIAEEPQGLADFHINASLSEDCRTGTVKLDYTGTTNFLWTLASPVLSHCSSDRFAAASPADMVLGDSRWLAPAESLSIPNPALWSAEEPDLYEVVVKTASGDTFRRAFGFRKVEIADGQLKVNGKRIIVKGVNRHEWHPKTGYTLTLADMEEDIRLLKEFGFNAVRTCHYPNDPRWYDLCDRHGIYLVAEADIECHGSGHPGKKTCLSHLPSWRKTFVERAERMVDVLRDHPSVIVWSLGNESGTGDNLKAAYAAVKAKDATRPVQYEGLFWPYGYEHFKTVKESDILYADAGPTPLDLLARADGQRSRREVRRDGESLERGRGNRQPS